MGTETRSTPISGDDTSRLVSLVDRVHRRLDVISMAAIYARLADGPVAKQHWLQAVRDLRQADALLGRAIATWHGRYEPWGVHGPHPTAAGVRLGVDRMRAGLATALERLQRDQPVSAAAAADLDAVIRQLRKAYALMLPAWTDARGGHRPKPSWTAVAEPVRWGDLPAGSPAALTEAAMQGGG